MLIISKVVNHGLCCIYCQENVNVHGCEGCNKEFGEGDLIYCSTDSGLVCGHYHEQCKPKILKGD